jgi:hypothetical protein
MSYLLQYARRVRAARVDERLRLNRPGLYGGAYVRVYVEDTTRGRRGSGDPHTRLRIADCTNAITLEFSLATAEYRENSLFKVDTLLGALHRFRDALAAEVELAARSERRAA